LGRWMTARWGKAGGNRLTKNSHPVGGGSVLDGEERTQSHRPLRQYGVRRVHPEDADLRGLISRAERRAARHDAAEDRAIWNALGDGVQIGGRHRKGARAREIAAAVLRRPRGYR